LSDGATAAQALLGKRFRVGDAGDARSAARLRARNLVIATIPRASFYEMKPGRDLFAELVDDRRVVFTNLSRR